jgi:hypothetical protein
MNTEPGKGTLPEIDPEAMEGEVYNMCHFWSNFEIARLDFFRSQEYEDFFNMMDRSGGFWMERVSLTTHATYDHVLTLVTTVGRRTHPLPGSRCPPLPKANPLLPRLRLPTHYHPALPRQPPSASDPAHTLLRTTRRPERKSYLRHTRIGPKMEHMERRRRVLGEA